jgi:hypothetical protein
MSSPSTVSVDARRTTTHPIAARSLAGSLAACNWPAQTVGRLGSTPRPLGKIATQPPPSCALRSQRVGSLCLRHGWVRAFRRAFVGRRLHVSFVQLVRYELPFSGYEVEPPASKRNSDA